MLLLTGCSEASDKAKREYQMMVKSGATLEEQCKKLKDIEAAYLAEENMAEYRMARIEAGVKCTELDLQRLRYQ